MQDTHKDKLFDKTHAELVKYQQGSINKMIDDLAMDVILTSYHVKETLNTYHDRDASAKNYKKLLKQVEGIAYELEDMLYFQLKS